MPKIALFCAILACAGCESKSASSPVKKTVSVGWRPIASWSGRGNVQTESFDIGSGQWRLKWETSHETSPGAGKFRVMVHSAVSGRPLELAVEHQGTGKDIAYVNEDPRLFHLVIESSNEDWSISAEEAVVGEPGPAK